MINIPLFIPDTVSEMSEFIEEQTRVLRSNQPKEMLAVVGEGKRNYSGLGIGGDVGPGLRQKIGGALQRRDGAVGGNCN
jgi:hypothetical protein